ncbi:MAG: bifunctional diaminohydroxyphosphoribosylaminopyrimidine deaminase/5-amino-6-(5-phosphoribosylamino)uracil reductase RibD, partial [Planctomycetota bacterium]
RALDLASQGIGCVEPNPAVGAVIADDQGRVLGEGWHQRFGGPHAEVHALAAAGDAARGASLYVTLEPCCHFGKTPPCTQAVIAAGIRRVVVATADPATHGVGHGIDELRAAGIEVEVGLLGDEARRLIARFTRLMTTGLPWVHAKWAMTLDGRIASRTGHSKWISSDASRAVVHQLRGRMDAIMTGAGTVRCDDPLLTARPRGARIPLRVVIDADGSSLHADTKLVKSLSQGAVLVCVADHISGKQIERLKSLEVEVLPCAVTKVGRIDLHAVMAELGRRDCTNVLTEAGSEILGSLFDSSLIDEVHIFMAPRLTGGSSALGPLGGLGRDSIPKIPNVQHLRHTSIGDDLLIEADIRRG